MHAECDVVDVLLRWSALQLAISRLPASHLLLLQSVRQRDEALRVVDAVKMRMSSSSTAVQGALNDAMYNSAAVSLYQRRMSASSDCLRQALLLPLLLYAIAMSINL
jgi:hypothetical protein